MRDGVEPEQRRHPNSVRPVFRIGGKKAEHQDQD